MKPDALRKKQREEKKARIKSFKEDLFPIKVNLDRRAKVIDGFRAKLREWFKKNGIRTFDRHGEVADVMVHKWTSFHFKDEGMAVLFKLTWGGTK